MENLTIEETEYTPFVELNKEGVLNFKGKSYSENTFKFYKPIIGWINEYFDSIVAETTTINMELIYFNSSSSRVLFDIFNIFEKNIGKSKISINWIYDKEDESSMEDGEGLQSSFKNLDIKLVSK